MTMTRKTIDTKSVFQSVQMFPLIFSSSDFFDGKITGKSFSEALILASVNPQYDMRLFIEFPEKYKFRTCCVQKLFFCFDIQKNICTQHVLNLYFSGNSMNNLLSYCGLTDSRMRASDTDLPVTSHLQRNSPF